MNIATWLKNQGYPPGFRVLCHNCNLAIGFYGYCPHVENGGRFDEPEEVGYPQSQLYCINGHPMFGAHLWISGKTRKRRVCRICKNASKRRRRAEKQEALPLLRSKT